METLISMTDFVLEAWKLVKGKNDNCQDNTNQLVLIHNYSEFLKLPLTLGFFVPTDEDGNVLREPIDISEFHPRDWETMSIEHDKYKEAKERVLFEGFEVVKSKIIGQTGELKLKKVGYTQVWAEFTSPTDFYMRYPSVMVRTVEDLINDYSPISLTETAKKKIGL